MDGLVVWDRFSGVRCARRRTTSQTQPSTTKPTHHQPSIQPNQRTVLRHTHIFPFPNHLNQNAPVEKARAGCHGPVPVVPPLAASSMLLLRRHTTASNAARL